MDHALVFGACLVRVWRPAIAQGSHVETHVKRQRHKDDGILLKCQRRKKIHTPGGTAPALRDLSPLSHDQGGREGGLVDGQSVIILCGPLGDPFGMTLEP